ncbi:hypothetical protein [Parasegetibacter sp. NRK P23]|uniref:hypothetical protein n=1 Tax=Parasegetibacter sp. NRK P23 TaxID=2942999 RepID=UPI0020438F20|nr:hypothetical protein [Parasegetibacter sp. NRK P23]MCM5527311.1 hypothetical protein [Parasegetibacter sp. NRK P23]
MKQFAFTLILAAFTTCAMAQHEHHHSAEHKDSIPEHKIEDHGPVMSHAFSKNLPMQRNGSGTAWLPDAAPMYGYMLHSKKWMYMVHGNVFLRYNNQDIARKGTRGASQFDAPNWVMGMGQRAIGKNGLFRFSAMLSIDRLTLGGDGYPLLFQSGETWQGQPLTDRQHPHDLFAELSVGYTHALSKKTDVFVYFGYPGEPAIGGTAFMHRPSSLYNPDAPLGHHWQDATHITFGTTTLGVRHGKFKLEGSLFTGREPDENRYDFDQPRFDSWAGRISFNPGKEWSLQVSKAYIKSPESLEPGKNIHRTSASIIHAKQLPGGNLLNSALVWGYNYQDAQHKEHAVLAESAYAFGKNAVYGKYEFVQKSTHELSLDEAVYGHDAIFNINALTLGLNRRLLTLGKTDFSIGTQATFYGAGKKLEPVYGKNPWSYQVFFRINPGRMM